MPGSDSGNHEWRYQIRTSDLSTLIGLLGGSPGDDIIDLLAENFTGSELMTSKGSLARAVSRRWATGVGRDARQLTAR